jgi:hypothetical protein
VNDGPVVGFTVKELLAKIEARLETLERSAARQATVRWSVLLSVTSGPGAALLTWILTRH